MSEAVAGRPHPPALSGWILAQCLAASLLLAWPAVAGVPACATDGLTRLVMFYEPGCTWCARWEEEIGSAYPKTLEGCRAPLRRVDMTRPRPDDLSAVEGVRFSPTFVLVERGREVGRILGYPGEDFFWPLLDDLLAKLEPPPGR